MAAISTSLIQASFPDYPRQNFELNSKGSSVLSSNDLDQLSCDLRNIKDVRDRTGCINAKKRDLKQKIERIKTILEESEKNGLPELLFRSKKSCQHLEEIREQIRILTNNGNKTLCRKINLILSNSLKASFQPISIHTEFEKPLYLEKQEEKYLMNLKEELEGIKDSDDLLKEFEKDMDRVVEICILCINNVDGQLSNIRRDLFLILSEGLGCRLKNRSKIIEGLAKQFHRITGELPKEYEVGGIFSFQLLLKAKEYHLEGTKIKITSFINSIILPEFCDPAYTVDWPAWREQITETIKEILLYKVLDKELICKKISGFINTRRLPLITWISILQKEKDIAPYLASQVTYINLYGYANPTPEQDEQYQRVFCNASIVCQPPSLCNRIIRA